MGGMATEREQFLELSHSRSAHNTKHVLYPLPPVIAHSALTNLHILPRLPLHRSRRLRHSHLAFVLIPFVRIYFSHQLVEMLLTAFIPLVLAALPSLAQDIVYDSAHNATTIVGTWSTGSKAVSTGAVRTDTRPTCSSLADFCRK